MMTQRDTKLTGIGTTGQSRWDQTKRGLGRVSLQWQIALDGARGHECAMSVDHNANSSDAANFDIK